MHRYIKIHLYSLLALAVFPGISSIIEGQEGRVHAAVTAPGRGR